MSVLINMEMPKSCWLCHFQDCGNCVLNNHKVVDNCIMEDRRDEDCPLVPVPPHGDLIDRDALNYTMLYKENWMSGTGVEAPAVWRKDIEDAPTIIPASEEDGCGRCEHCRINETGTCRYAEEGET